MKGPEAHQVSSSPHSEFSRRADLSVQTAFCSETSDPAGALPSRSHGFGFATLMLNAPFSAPDTSHVPCKFYRQGACQAGNACPFSHDLSAASETVCKYFAKVRLSRRRPSCTAVMCIRRRCPIRRALEHGRTDSVPHGSGQLQVWSEMRQYPRPSRRTPRQLRQERRDDWSPAKRPSRRSREPDDIPPPAVHQRAYHLVFARRSAAPVPRPGSLPSSG